VLRTASHMRIPVLFLIGVAVLASCSQEKKGTVIARVGTAELTLEDARAHIDTAQGGTDVRLHRYAQSWVNA
jgi:hypothetical protein